MSTVTGKNLEITNFGSIEHLLLPAGWICSAEGRIKQIAGRRQQMTCYSPRDSRVQFSIFLQLSPYDDVQAARVHALFASTPRCLLKENLEEYSDLLRGAESPRTFTPSKFSLESWNGKDALVISGCWLKTKEELFWVLVDCLGDGRLVQEVIFMSPEEQYSSHLLEVMFSFKSIRWKQTGA